MGKLYVESIRVCPQTNQEERITVEFTEYNALGMHGYSKQDFTCEIGEDINCQYDKRCPLYVSALPK